MILIAAALATTTAAWEPLTFEDFPTKRGGNAVYTQEAGGVIMGETRPNTPNTFLCTDRIFHDFELELQFKVDNELNSGIQIRSNSVPGYRNGTVHGYQCEIDATERSYSGGVYDESRRGWLQELSDNPEGREAIKRNEWNDYRILAVGDTIQTWINGVETAHVKDDMTKSGFIGLQVHGVGGRTDPLQVRWRNIRIRDFGAPMKPYGAKQILSADAGLDWMQKRDGSPAGWKHMGDYVEVAPGSGDIYTKDTWTDCQVHIEFMTTDNGREGQGNGNSGVFLMGRYEIQVLNSAPRGPLLNECGAIYNIKAPDYAMTKPAGEWQSYDIDFRAPRFNNDGEKTEDARITVWHNGTKIHDNVTVPRPTSGVRSNPESPEPGPIRLQDHGQDIKYRNFWVKGL